MCLNVILSLQMSVTLIRVYRPPSANVFMRNYRIPQKNVVWRQTVLLGDFNINWLEKTNRKQLKTLSTKFDLSQLMKCPFRITNTPQTCIDLFQFFSDKSDILQKRIIGIQVCPTTAWFCFQVNSLNKDVHAHLAKWTSVLAYPRVILRTSNML